MPNSEGEVDQREAAAAWLRRDPTGREVLLDSPNPACLLRLQPGATAFDPDYYVDPQAFWDALVWTYVILDIETLELNTG